MMNKKQILKELVKLKNQYETHKFLYRIYSKEGYKFSAELCKTKMSHVGLKIKELTLLLTSENEKQR